MNKYIRSGQDEHRKIAERILGRKLPTRVQVHHVDGNGKNNDHSNLVICPDQAYHRLLHMRTAALEATGDVNKRKCSFCKQWDDVKQLGLITKETHQEGQYYHRSCVRAYKAQRRKKTI